MTKECHRFISSHWFVERTSQGRLVIFKTDDNGEHLPICEMAGADTSYRHIADLIADTVNREFVLAYVAQEET